MAADKPNISLAEQLHTAEVYEEFCELIFSDLKTYEELMELLETWGIYSSLGALSRFKASHRGPWAMARARREQESFLKEHGADLDEAERRLVAMRIFTDAASPDTSTKDVLRMRDQHLGAAKLKIENERLKMDAVKLEQAETKLAQSQELINMQRRKIEALEAQAAAAAKTAERAKETLKSGGMSDADRAELMSMMDHMILGTPKPKKEAA